jgi:hypothetical protein
VSVPNEPPEKFRFLTGVVISSKDGTEICEGSNLGTNWISLSSLLCESENFDRIFEERVRERVLFLA